MLRPCRTSLSTVGKHGSRLSRLQTWLGLPQLLLCLLVVYGVEMALKPSVRCMVNASLCHILLRSPRRPPERPKCSSSNVGSTCVRRWTIIAIRKSFHRFFSTAGNSKPVSWCVSSQFRRRLNWSEVNSLSVPKHLYRSTMAPVEWCFVDVGSVKFASFPCSGNVSTAPLRPDQLSPNEAEETHGNKMGWCQYSGP